MKNLLLSVLLVSSIVHEVSAISWGEITPLATQTVKYLNDNKIYVFLITGLAVAGASIFYHIYKPRYKVVEFGGKKCTLIIRNGILRGGTLEENGKKPTTLSSADAFTEFTKLSEAKRQADKQKKN